MKSVLLSVFCSTQVQWNFCTGIINLLTARGYEVEVLTFKEPYCISDHVKRVILNEFPKSLDQYDIVFSFNIKGFEYIKELLIQENKPHCYICCASDIEEEYLYEWEYVDQYLLINNTRHHYGHLFPKEISTNILSPFEFVDMEKTNSVNSDSRMVIYVDNNTLFKILPTINRLIKYKFILFNYEINRIKKLVNSNVKVISPDDGNIEEYMRNSLMVLGNGEFVLKGILMEKPAIVVGPHGFGKIVSVDNIGLQYQTFFQGRVGADSDEIIPPGLLSFEILNVLNHYDYFLDNSRKVRFYMKDSFYRMSVLIDDMIKVIVSKKKGVKSMNFKLNTGYHFLPMHNNTCLIIDPRMQKIHLRVGEEELKIMNEFKDGMPSDTVYQVSGFDNRQIFDEFVEQLVLNKILIPYV